jgi:hypothetical protein
VLGVIHGVLVVVVQVQVKPDPGAGQGAAVRMRTVAEVHGHFPEKDSSKDEADRVETNLAYVYIHIYDKQICIF